MSELAKGGVIPLFDRLASGGLDAGPSQLETMESLQDSISRELRMLFNTRSPLPPAEYLDGAATVLEYGIPDLSAFDAQSTSELEALASSLRLAIERYEPRLTDVTVQVLPVSGRRDAAVVRIGAQARAGLALRRVDFEMTMGVSDSLMKVN